MAYKPCNRCGQDIGFRKEGTRILPINPDGTPHRCNPRPAMATEKAAEPDSVVGIYQGISFKRISVTRKDRRVLSSATTPRLLTELADPVNPVKAGMKVRVVFDKDGNADTIEICPDQPAPPAEPPNEEKPADKPAPAEPHVPADAAPATVAKPSQAFTPGDLFSPKDRLIVAQCLVKAYTDLWMQTHTPDTITFADARAEILAAVKADLPQVMAAGVR